MSSYYPLSRSLRPFLSRSLISVAAAAFVSGAMAQGAPAVIDVGDGVIAPGFTDEALEILKTKGVRHVAGHDFGNPLFGVTRAVREVIGEPDEIIGMCWYKRI